MIVNVCVGVNRLIDRFVFFSQFVQCPPLLKIIKKVESAGSLFAILVVKTMIMEKNYEQTAYLLSARTNKHAARGHLCYKKVILISNACQPNHAKDVRPQQIITMIDRVTNPSIIPIIVEKNTDFGYLIPSSDYNQAL